MSPLQYVKFNFVTQCTHLIYQFTYYFQQRTTNQTFADGFETIRKCQVCSFENPGYTLCGVQFLYK